MPLKLYRRHTKTCPYFGRKNARSFVSCKCPIWVQGTLGGRSVRQSVDQTSWQGASTLLLEWNATGRIGEVRPESHLVSEAVVAYLDDCVSRHLAETTLRKRKLLLEKQLVKWCQTHGLTRMSAITPQKMLEFRNSWTESPLSSLKKLERLRAFFKFCVLNRWITQNPTEGIKPPKVEPNPTLPFSDEEMKRILRACDLYEGDQDRMRAFILVMRYSGLRISDTATLKRSAVKDGKIHTRQEKTGQPVYVPIPPFVSDALDKVKALDKDKDRKYYFWSGNGKVQTLLGNWRKYLGWLFERAGISGAHSHRFRDTFAVSLLLKGVSVENVATLLGNTPTVVLKHYSPWVKARQLALEEAVKKAW